MSPRIILLLVLNKATIVQALRQKPFDNNENLFSAGASVEERLRAVVRYKKIRIREFFRDFDPLRKGFITG